MTLIQLAIAFVTRHPAVTSAIAGPRTMEHLESYLAADGIDLPGDLLDRIDEIVPPGVTVNVADNQWSTSRFALDAASRRRSSNPGRTGHPPVRPRRYCAGPLARSSFTEWLAPD
jgi:hypothetical protein